MTLCVDSVQRAEEMKGSGSEEEIKAEFMKLKESLEKARGTYVDFRSKSDVLSQTLAEIERWGTRLTELEGILAAELGKDAGELKKKADELADIPGNLIVAGLLIKWMDDKDVGGKELFHEIMKVGWGRAVPRDYEGRLDQVDGRQGRGREGIVPRDYEGRGP